MGQHRTSTRAPELDAPLWEPDGRPESAVPGAGEGPDGLVSPGRTVRSRQLAEPADFLPEVTDPPALGWRRAAWRAGARWAGPGPHELQHREWTRLIRRPLATPATIAVVSPKGGVGKSTIAIVLGEVLACVRGHLVAALDANSDAGNLVTRVPEPHSVWGASQMHANAGQLGRRTDLAPYLSHSESGLCVVRASGETGDRLGPAEYRRLLGLLAKFYSVVVVDLGTGIRDPGFLAVVEAADAVVPVTEPVFDAADVLIDGLDWLSRRFPGMIRTATAVINRTDPNSREQDPGRIAEALEDWVAQVVEVPTDPALSSGQVPHWPALATETRHAYLELAATVIDTLPDGT